MSRKKVNNKTLKCPQCGEEFIVKEYSKRIYCSDKCSREHWKGSRKNSVLVNCPICSKEYYAIPSRIKDGKDKYCSRECYNKWQKSLPKKPKKPTKYQKCGRPLGMKHTPEVRRKMSEIHKYTKNHLWKGGISKINQTERHNVMSGVEYKLWRDAVFQRDDYSCIWCGIKNTKGLGKTVRLEADHILPYKDYPELRLAIDNGRTLCLDCHRKRHSKG